MYTIKTVSSLTGLSTETLRAWERRYGTITPARDDKGRRLYSQQDVERLNLLHSATRQGFTISKITALDNGALQNLLAANNPSHPVQKQDMFFLKIVDALLQYRIELVEDLLKRAFLALDPLSFAQEVLLPTLHKVGNLWHEGKITIAQEHMFSACVKRLVLSMVHSMQPLSGPNPRVMFATLSGEQHEFGILLTCLLAANQRCTCYYLGPDLPWTEFVTASAQLKPSVIISSIVNTSPDDEMLKDLADLAASLPSQIQLWIGGLGSQLLFERHLLPDKYVYISNLADFNRRIEQLIATPSGSK